MKRPPAAKARGLVPSKRKSARGLSTLCKAIAAIDGAVILGNEGNAGWGATFCAHSVMHFAWFAVVGSAFACIAAGLAACGLILETFFRVEFLLARCEHELRSAILADQCLVLVHGRITPCKIKIQWPFVLADLVFAPTTANRKSRS